MYNPRDIDELQKEISLALINQGSTLNDISEGSVLSALIRSIAASQQKQEIALQSVIKSFFISEATGVDLDLKAGDVGIQRKSGEVATGSVLVSSQEGSLFLPINTVLTDPASGVQVVLGDGSDVSINSFVERRIAVAVNQAGEVGNLKAGTRLISPAYSSGSFVVGSHRTSTGEVCGDLSGGRNIESDEQLRGRVINTTLNTKGTTEESLRNILLEQFEITWAYVTTKPGIVEAWIDSASVLPESSLNIYREILEQNKAAGTLVVLNQATRHYIDINVFIRPDSSADLETLTDSITGLVKSYLESLRIGSGLDKTELSSNIFNLGSILEASIIEPKEEIVIDQFSVLRAGNIVITYTTS